MAYGDYDGPNKPDKGAKHGSCNRTRCQAPNAIWYNHGSYAWYCEDCMRQIGHDPWNLKDWNAMFYPRLKHPQFETVEMMQARGQFDYV